LVALGTGLGVALAKAGAAAFTGSAALAAFLSAYPGVTGIREVLVSFIGPGRVWIIARVDIDDDLDGAQVKSLVRGIESGMRRESEYIHRVDIVPTGGGYVAGHEASA